MKRNIRKFIIEVKRKIYKVRAFLHKIDKKLERDQELSDKLSKTDKEEIKEFKKDKKHLANIAGFNNQFLGGYNGTDWNMLYSIFSGVKSEKYIPEDIWINHLTPRFNDVAQMPAYEDKYIYDLLFYDIKRPKTYFRFFNKQVYDSDFKSITEKEAQKKVTDIEKLIAKPSWRGSGRGRGVKVFQENNVDELFHFLRVENNKDKNHSDNYIIQEYIPQHEQISKLYSKSLNTIKIMTVRIDNKIVHINSYFRAGRKKSEIDSGYIVAVKEDGSLTTPVFDRDLKRHVEHEDTGVRFSSVRIPSYNQAIQICKKAHDRLLHFDVVSWDIAIDKDGDPVLIEMNLSAQDIQFLQMTNGPLFGEYTEEILEKMEINLHFNV